MFNTLMGRYGGVAGVGSGIKYFKFVLLGGDGGATNYNGVGGRGGGGLTEYIISTETMTGEIILEARSVVGGDGSNPTGGHGGTGYFLTTSVGLPNGPGTGTWAGGPDSLPLKPSVIAAVGGGGGEGRADDLNNVANNINPSIPFTNFGPIGAGGGTNGGAAMPGTVPTNYGGYGTQTYGGQGTPSPHLSGNSGSGDFLLGGYGNQFGYGGGNHAGGGGGGYYGGGGGKASEGPNPGRYGGGGGGASGHVQSSYPQYYSGFTTKAGKSKYINLQPLYPGAAAGGSGGVFLTSAPLEEITANTVTYTQILAGPSNYLTADNQLQQITLKSDGTFTQD